MAKKVVVFNDSQNVQKSKPKNTNPQNTNTKNAPKSPSKNKHKKSSGQPSVKEVFLNRGGQMSDIRPLLIKEIKERLQKSEIKFIDEYKMYSKYKSECFAFMNSYEHIIDKAGAATFEKEPTLSYETQLRLLTMVNLLTRLSQAQIEGFIFRNLLSELPSIGSVEELERVFLRDNPGETAWEKRISVNYIKNARRIYNQCMNLAIASIKTK